MKKIISLITVLVMTVMLSVTAYASFLSTRVIDKTDAVTVYEANEMNENMKAFFEKTGVDTAIVVVESLTQGTFQKEAVYYNNTYFRMDNGYVLIQDIKTGKIIITAFGKYAERIGEKAGLFELGELLAEKKVFDESYTDGTNVFLHYIQQMIDAYGEDEFTQSMHNTADAFGMIIDIGKWFIGPVIGTLFVMGIYKSIVRNQYRNLEATAISEFESKTETVFYYANDYFVREYIHTDND